jgi:hypothetical protein
VSGETKRAAARAKAQERAARAVTYRTGAVVEVTDATHVRVDIGTKDVPVVVPASLTAELGDQVQVRIRGNDYVLAAVLDGERQAAWLVETATTAATTANVAEVKAAAALAEAQLTPDTVLSTGSTGSIAVNGGTLRVSDAGGEDLTVLTPGASVFRGDADVENLAVSEHVTIEKGARVTLAAGVTAPGVAPVVDSVWPVGLTLLDGAGAAVSPSAVCRNEISSGDCWWSLATDASGVVTVRRHVLATGAQDEAFVMALQPGTYLSSLSGRGSYVTLLRKTGSTLYADEYLVDSGTGEYLSSQSLGTSWELAGDPVIGTNGTVPVVGYKSSASNREVFKVYASGYDTSPSSTISNGTVNADTPATPKGVLATTGDWGALRYVFGHAGWFRATDASGAAQAGADFATASGNTVGVGYDASGFWSADASGVIWRHDGPTWTDASYSKTFDVATSYYDSDSTGGTHETGLSPKRAATLLKRARVRVTQPGWVADTSGTDTVNALRTYAGAAGGTLYLAATATTASSTLTSIPTSGTTNSPVPFPDESSATIESAAGGTLIGGDGAVRLLGVDWDKTTKTAFTTTSGTHGAAGSGWYRRYGPMVQLYWKGSATVAQNAQVTLNLSTILPAALLPPEIVGLACGGGVDGDRAANGEFRPTGVVSFRQQYSTAVAVGVYACYLLNV